MSMYSCIFFGFFISFSDGIGGGGSGPAARIASHTSGGAPLICAQCSAA